jgi:uncharacterized protein YqhQ
MPKGEYLQYGGQAIIEGVMMRSPRYFSVACRAPNGNIVHQTEAIESTWIGRQKWLKLPLLRGTLGLLDAMALGNRALKFASRVQTEPEYQVGAPEQPVATPAAGGKPGTQTVSKEGKIQDIAVIGALIVGLVVGLALFKLAPNLISATLGKKFNLQHDWQKNLITETTVAIFFISYLALIGLMKEVHRIFEYHGAEHKAINTMEADQDLTIDNCLKQTRLHPRCGTSFAIIVLIVSLFCFTPLPRISFSNALLEGFVRFLMEIPLLFLIAGISYELLRFAGKFRNATIVKIAFWPGLMSQYLTTREPDASQTEVALVALKEVLAAEQLGKAPVAAVAREDILESSPVPIP